MITTWIHNLFSKNKIEEEEGYGEMSVETKRAIRRLASVGRILAFSLGCLAWAFGNGMFSYFFISKNWVFVLLVGCSILSVGTGFAIIGLICLVKWIVTGDSELGILDWLEIDDGGR
jgi:hypothetical protein